MKSRGLRTKRLLTLLGWIHFKRSMYRCPTCGIIRYPGDEELDIVNTSRSPGVRRQTARLASKETFQEASMDLEQLAGIIICRKAVERVAEQEGERMEAWMAAERRHLCSQDPPEPCLVRPVETLYIELDGTGIPMVKYEVQDRKGKQPDGTAKTREAKVGCVFTQSKLDEEGNLSATPHPPRLLVPSRPQTNLASDFLPKPCVGDYTRQSGSLCLVTEPNGSRTPRRPILATHNLSSTIIMLQNTSASYAALCSIETKSMLKPIVKGGPIISGRETLKPLWSKQPNGCPITPRRKKMPEHRLTTSIKIRTICDTVTIANKSYSSAQESLKLHVNILWAAGSSNPAWNGP